jgi:hypothetical protein
MRGQKLQSEVWFGLKLIHKRGMLQCYPASRSPPLLPVQPLYALRSAVPFRALLCSAQRRSGKAQPCSSPRLAGRAALVRTVAALVLRPPMAPCAIGWPHDASTMWREAGGRGHFASYPFLVPFGSFTPQAVRVSESRLRAAETRKRRSEAAAAAEAAQGGGGAD